MYRMVRHTPLSTGQKYGDIIRDGDLNPAVIQKMLSSGTLLRVNTPPLSELPEWDKQAGLLAGTNVLTIRDLLDVDVNELARKIKRPARIIKQWQDEALAWLNPPQNEPG